MSVRRVSGRPLMQDPTLIRVDMVRPQSSRFDSTGHFQKTI
jgi:hypothetical protein